MSEGVSLYIHIPFCKQKCLYCDFPSFSGKENLMVRYAKALSKEINKINRKVRTIFIGGGTPTYLCLEAWEIIKKSLDNLDKDKDIEFTVEGNPGTFKEEKLEFLKQIGVNRLSIGLQAWQNQLLKKLGRIHTREDFEQSFYMARKCGFKNINVDLMFGLPDQTLNQWIETLNNVMDMKPEHLSCYSLIIEEGTPFYKMYNGDKLKVPSEELERNMYEKTISILEENEYYQYEISNFSKRNKECKHNLTYWDLEDYIGCGAGAHSYIDGIRYRNEINIEKYIDKINENEIASVENHKNIVKDDMEEFMFMGLRKIKGISIKEFERRFETNIYSVYGDVIYKYKNLNLLNEREGHIALSKKGIQVSNTIMSEFILD
ncbi:radical SAM family heme chaperone HemW [Haloimpatiens sp. FM7330]|uniref:radical SAM family heme chaperone HemW n=1 Tax=Haloimpatiens sp. FM7330 TaxID=3298610 RepID=UPI0036402FC7